MKDLSLLVWLTQLGLSTVLPLAGFILLAVWLRDSWGWGSWVIWAGVLLGLTLAIDGFRTGIKQMSRLAKKKGKPEPPIAFNDHD